MPTSHLVGAPYKVANHSKSIKDGLPDTVVALLARWKSFQSIRSYIDMEPLDLIRARTSPTSSRCNSSNRFRLLTAKPGHLQ